MAKKWKPETPEDWERVADAWDDLAGAAEAHEDAEPRTREATRLAYEYVGKLCVRNSMRASRKGAVLAN